MIEHEELAQQNPPAMDRLRDPTPSSRSSLPDNADLITLPTLNLFWLERHAIVSALRLTTNRQEAARHLGITPRILTKKIRNLQEQDAAAAAAAAEKIKAATGADKAADDIIESSLRRLNSLRRLQSDKATRGIPRLRAGARARARAKQRAGDREDLQREKEHDQ